MNVVGILCVLCALAAAPVCCFVAGPAPHTQTRGGGIACRASPRVTPASSQRSPLHAVAAVGLCLASAVALSAGFPTPASLPRCPKHQAAGREELSPLVADRRSTAQVRPRQQQPQSCALARRSLAPNAQVVTRVAAIRLSVLVPHITPYSSTNIPLNPKPSTLSLHDSLPLTNILRYPAVGIIITQDTP